MTEHRIAVARGVTLQVEVDGAGPPLLLINGAGSTLRSWDLVTPILAESFQVVRHDVRGTGHSDSGDAGDDRFEQYADDLIAVCDELSIRRASLWGMAWGARVALVLAARHSARIDRLMLADFAIDPADPPAQIAGYQQAKKACADEFVQMAERPVGWDDHADTATVARTIAATHAHPDLMPFVERVEHPTLIATGEFDPNLESSRRALPGFANALLEVVPLAGHGAVLQHPDVMLDLAINHFS